MSSPVCARAFSALASTKRRDAHLDIEDRAIVEGLGAHFCLARAEDGHENLCEAVGDGSRASCGALLREVYGYVAELILFAAI